MLSLPLALVVIALSTVPCIRLDVLFDVLGCTVAYYFD